MDLWCVITKRLLGGLTKLCVVDNRGSLMDFPYRLRALVELSQHTMGKEKDDGGEDRTRRKLNRTFHLIGWLESGVKNSLLYHRAETGARGRVGVSSKSNNCFRFATALLL